MRTVSAGGVEVALREWGDASYAPMLCWHGAGDQSRLFADAAEVWANEDDLHVLAPDAPGHGASPPLADDDYRPTRLAAVAAGVLDEVGLAQAIWCGFSWGASIGVRFAAAYPQRTRALVLLDGALVDFRDDPALPEPAATDESLGTKLERGLRAEPTADVLDALRPFPVLVLTGTADAWRKRLSFDPVERFRSHVPGADVRELEGGVHDLLGRDVRNVARTIGDWLADRDLL
jgi:pimeloyl-ACP methyl ester carboxylesterase